jgi:hypothetical protein
VLETSELSLEDYCFASKTRNSDGPGKYRHVVDAMRTCAWFHALRMRIGAKSTYEMEKVLEPGSFGVDDSGTAYKRNKWRGYRLGKHTPSPALVQAVEQLHPGTLHVFDHVLWDTLRPGCTLAHHHLLNRLGPTASKILSSPQLRRQDGSLRTDFVARVERVADLDGFACLVTLLRNAINVNDAAEAQHLSLALCRSTIASGPLLYSLGIAGPLADYINGHFLCRATAEGGGYGLNAHDFLLRAKLSARLIYVAEGNENCRFTFPEKVDFILDVLHGRYGDSLAQDILPMRSAAP